MQEIYIKASYKAIVFCHTTVLNQLQTCSTKSTVVSTCLGISCLTKKLMGISWSPGRCDTPSWQLLAGWSALSPSPSLSPGCHHSQLCLIKGLHGVEKRGRTQMHKSLDSGLSSCLRVKVPQLCKATAVLALGWCDMTLLPAAGRSQPMQSHHENGKKHSGLGGTRGAEGQKKQGLQPSEFLFP